MDPLIGILIIMIVLLIAAALKATYEHKHVTYKYSLQSFSHGWNIYGEMYRGSKLVHKGWLKTNPEEKYTSSRTFDKWFGHSAPRQCSAVYSSKAGAKKIIDEYFIPVFEQGLPHHEYQNPPLTKLEQYPLIKDTTDFDEAHSALMNLINIGGDIYSSEGKTLWTKLSNYHKLKS